MKTLALKKNIHEIVDEIENDQLLYTIYNLLKESKGNEDGKFWNTLTEEEKKVVLAAFEESEDDSKLIDSDLIFGQGEE